jgi:hypothetical protein
VERPPGAFLKNLYKERDMKNEKRIFEIQTEERRILVQTVSPVLYKLKGRIQLPDEIAILFEDAPLGKIGLVTDLPIMLTMQEAKQLIDILSMLTCYSPVLLKSKN